MVSIRSRTILLAAVLTSACATVGQFRQDMDQFVGLPVARAQEVFGYQFSARELGAGERAYTWTRVESGVSPGFETPTTVHTFRTDDSKHVTIMPGTYYPPQAYSSICEFTFVADAGGIIQRWHAQGDGCRGRLRSGSTLHGGKPAGTGAN